VKKIQSLKHKKHMEHNENVLIIDKIDLT